MTQHAFRHTLVRVAVASAFAVALPTAALAGNGSASQSNSQDQDYPGHPSNRQYSQNEGYQNRNDQSNQYNQPYGSNGPSQSSGIMSEHFNALDANGDSRISRAELDAQTDRSGRGSQDRFNALDTNHDGVISRSEFNAHNDSRWGDAGAASSYARATDLMGSDVVSANGQDIGEVKDLLVDVKASKVQSAIVSLDDDSGNKLYRYPLSAFGSARNDGELVLKSSERPPQASQTFARDNWPSWVSNNSGNASASHRRAGVWQASRLIGKDIEDRNGDHLGEITDLVIDRNGGDVKYAVLRYDRPWSLDNPLVAVPLDSLNFGDGRHVSMNVDRDKVDSRIGFESSAPQNVVFERWIVLVPEGAASAASGNTTLGTNSGAGTPASSTNSSMSTSSNSEGNGTTASTSGTSETTPSQISSTSSGDTGASKSAMSDAQTATVPSSGSGTERAGTPTSNQ